MALLYNKNPANWSVWDHVGIAKRFKDEDISELLKIINCQCNFIEIGAVMKHQKTKWLKSDYKLMMITYL